MKCINVLGTHIACLTYPTALEVISTAVAQRKSSYICVSAVHLVMECLADTKLRSGVNRSLLTTADGMPLVWLQKLFGCTAERVYGPTLMQNVCQVATKKHWKIFLVGGAVGQGKILERTLKRTYPRLKLIGSFDTPTRPIPSLDNTELLHQINTLGPDIIFVGTGCPTQERWMIANHKKINHGVLIGVGAAFDFLTGNVRQAPKWIQDLGLEWLFRLSQDPKRLWRRYTITNFRFLCSLLVAMLRRELCLIEK